MEDNSTENKNSERRDNSGGVRSFVDRAQSQVGELTGDNRGRNQGPNQNAQNQQSGFGRGPVRKNNFDRNRGGHGRNNQNQHGRREQQNEFASRQPRRNERNERNERGDRYDKVAHAIRETVDSIPKRPQRGAKEETLEDIRRDIITIEKEIALEISDISVLKLNV
ncbi:MAG: hypothetical protein IKH41_01655 [Clostridia bacterium]|nr:hypothetical protein [Clostridia bacterium]